MRTGGQGSSSAVTFDEASNGHYSANDLNLAAKSMAMAGVSLHGDTAARRRAVTELLFFASVGDLKRCQRIVRLWSLQVSDATCCDYDKRTPLHLAASEGSWSVAEWLLESGANINFLDRFKSTPLEDAVRGDYHDLAKMLMNKGGLIWSDGKLKPLESSKLKGAGINIPARPFDLDADWEIDPNSLQIEEIIGEGEFGIVHKATWYGTVVAAKVLKNTSEIALGDFRAEIEVLRKVHHPNAVQFLGACTKQQPYILITELMCGGSMADCFRMMKVMSLRRSVELALDAARGLAYLHNRKPAPIVHRDMKPANLMIAGAMSVDRDSLVYETGVMKLADFGLSKSLPMNKHAGYDLEDTFTLTGETGSYRYMAPEVFRHEPYNFKVDVYSFSMILYQLFEHQPPFAGTDPVEAARNAALYDMRPHLQQLQSRKEPFPPLRKLIEQCWHPNPELRPNFTSIIADLTTVLAAMPRKNKSGPKGPPAAVIAGADDRRGSRPAPAGASDKSNGCCSIS